MRSGTRCWLTALALAVAGCGSSNASQFAPDPSLLPVVAEPASPDPTVAIRPTPTAPASAAADLDLPAEASISFGGIEFELLSAETSNEDPVSRSQGLGLPSTSRYLYVQIAVENPLEFATLTINERTFLSLRTDGSDLKATLESNDISPVSVVRPGTTGTYSAVFKIPATFTPRDAALIFGEPESQQVALALQSTGQNSPSKAALVRVAAFDFNGEVAGSPACGPTRLRASVTELLVSLDLPADLGTSSGLPRRAAAGSHFLEFAVEFEVLETGSGSDGCVRTMVSDDLVRLSVGGLDVADHYVQGANDVEATTGDTISLTVGYMVRVAVSTTLTLGDPSGQTIMTSMVIDEF